MKNYTGFSAVNCTSITCTSRHPIIWEIIFTPPLWTEVEDADGIPYKITTDRLPCSHTENENTCLTLQYYFQSNLTFNATNLSNRTTSIAITCRGFTNVSVLETWYVNVSQSLNISSGKYITHSDSIRNKTKTMTLSSNLDNGNSKDIRISEKLGSENEIPLCPNLTVEYDKRRGIHTCFFSNETHLSVNVSVLTHLHCQDWSHCPWLISPKSEKICQGTSFSTAHLNKAGLFYCEPSADQIVYWPTIKIPGGGNETKYAIIDEQRDNLNRLVLYNDTTINDTINRGWNTLENDDTDIAMKCSAPKFLAFKWFKLEAYYSYGERTRLAECRCRDSIEEQENYMEIISCKHYSKYNAMKIIFNCTVYLQSGNTFTITAEYGPRNFTSDSPAENETTDIQLWLIFGGLAFGLLTTIIIFLYCKLRRQKKQIQFSPEEIQAFMKGAMLNTLNQSKPQSAILMPYDTSLEIPRTKIKMELKLLGEGAFGKVMKGRVGERYVAIKTINKCTDDKYFRALLSELKIMTFVGKHDNIVELIGANTERLKKKEVLLIFEFCENGNVLTYIRENRSVFVNQLTDDLEGYRLVNSTVEYENKVCTKMSSEDLIRWAKEIATGMDFIASKNVYHGDLAARNILLSHSLVAKVGDFGLAKELKDYSLYVQRAECPLPLKWMSIESLRDLEFSIQSDVWSYGITLWELFSLGSTPYPGVEWNFQSWKRLWDGERMDRPAGANQSIYDIIKECWKTEPKDRPSFDELNEMFTIELGKLGNLCVAKKLPAKVFCICRSRNQGDCFLKFLKPSIAL
ncbi:unnamed protein product [Allacma fusca]|nr:unnamed protein product [Allacma fusca]